VPDPTAQVRLLTGLPADELADAQILDWLDFYPDPRLAAAEALDAYAGTLLDVTSDDITLAGSKRATTLMSRAARLREQVATEAAQAAEDDGFVFDIVDGNTARPELTEWPSR